MPSFTLKVNGQARTLNVPADTPLLWALRDHLDLVGTKYGCGMGLCGACTVHLNGAAIRSCQMPVSAVGNMPVTTIEGLDPAGSIRCRRPGATTMSRSAATARPARS